MGWPWQNVNGSTLLEFINDQSKEKANMFWIFCVNGTMDGHDRKFYSATLWQAYISSSKTTFIFCRELLLWLKERRFCSPPLFVVVRKIAPKSKVVMPTSLLRRLDPRSSSAQHHSSNLWAVEDGCIELCTIGGSWAYCQHDLWQNILLLHEIHTIIVYITWPKH